MEADDVARTDALLQRHMNATRDDPEGDPPEEDIPQVPQQTQQTNQSSADEAALSPQPPEAAGSPSVSASPDAAGATTPVRTQHLSGGTGAVGSREAAGTAE